MTRRSQPSEDDKRTFQVTGEARTQAEAEGADVFEGQKKGRVT